MLTILCPIVIDELDEALHILEYVRYFPIHSYILRELSWLSSWNFIGLLDTFCKDALCIIHQ